MEHPVISHSKEPKISRIVLGGGSFLEISPRRLEQICKIAQEIGIFRIDTSPCYGHSEKVIGEVLSKDLDFKIKTKVCKPSGRMLGRADVISSLESSLKNMKREKIECLLLHELDIRDIKSDAIETLINLKKEGITEKIGVSSDNESLLEFAKLGIFDTYMATINLADLANLDIMRHLSNDSRNTLVAKRTIANGVWRKDFRYRALKYYRVVRKEINLKNQQSYYFRHKILSRSQNQTLEAHDYMNFAFSWNLRAEILLGTRNIKHLVQFRNIEHGERLTHDEIDFLESNWREQAKYNWRAQT
jgi:aryl-alcohol dehydrogenase-like predicted oxidoreductase